MSETTTPEAPQVDAFSHVEPLHPATDTTPPPKITAAIPFTDEQHADLMRLQGAIDRANEAIAPMLATRKGLLRDQMRILNEVAGDVDLAEYQIESSQEGSRLVKVDA